MNKNAVRILNGFMIIDTYKKWLVLALIIFRLIAGCDQPQAKDEAKYLIRVGSSHITSGDFNRAFELHKTAYDYDELKDPAIRKSARRQFLRQMVERLILMERARELQIRVPEAAVEAAVEAIKSSYPEGEFKNTLLESAISYPAWRDELRVRMIMEAVVTKEITERLTVSAQEIETCRQADSSRAQATDEEITDILRREKTEAAYLPWLEKLRKRYTVDISKSDWEKAISS